MRNITISTDVYSKIWAAREGGEETEDAILRRLLKCPAVPKASTGKAYTDYKTGTVIPEGFEVFKVYKGTHYKAQVRGGIWYLLNNNTQHETLHQLTQAICDSSANAWRFWLYKDGNKEKDISTLRSKSKISVR